MIKRRIKITLINKTLKEIDMSNFKRIPEDMFSGRDEIYRVELPEGVECIGSNAFEGCESLSEVVLPSTLKEIESEAFINCINLAVINLNKEMNIDSSSFKGCPLIGTNV